MTPVQIIKLVDGRTLEIHHDDNPESPRMWENLGIMVCFHRQYNLGDTPEHHTYRSDSFSSFDELRDQIIKDHDPLVILPLFLYDHSGITIRVSGFSDMDSAGWDWGQIGFIFASKQRVKDEYGIKRITPKVKRKVESVLFAEVEVYRQYLEGDVHGFILRGATKQCDACGHTTVGEIIDSCWGFYGQDIKTNGMLSHLPKEKNVSVIFNDCRRQRI